MTSLFRPVRILGAAILAVLTTAPLCAAGGRQRAVIHPVAEKVTISGTVTDANTGLPLKGASINAGESTVSSDDSGHYLLTCIRNADVTASRVGYVTVLHPAAGSPLDFALPQTQTITVRTTSGQTFALDYASTKFGYVIVFSGYAAGDSPNLCKPDGSHWEPPKDEMKRIVGPAHTATSAPCCDRGPVQAIDVEMKNGEKTTAYLNDNCFGYQVDILGIERSSAAAKYIHLTDVADITFP